MTTPFATTRAAPGIAGLQPVRPVSAASVVQLAVQPLPAQFPPSAGGIRELPVWDEAVADARRLVLDRLAAEADRHGADGVVNVRLEERSSRWLDEGLEIVATGTAVRGLGSVSPVLTNLDEAELRTLRGAGAAVAGLVHASRVVAVLAGPETIDRYRYGGNRRNFESPDFTSAVATLRKQLAGSLVAQAQELRSDGILGLASSVSPRWDHVRRRGFSESRVVLDCRALGTAVRRSADAQRARPDLALALDQETP